MSLFGQRYRRSLKLLWTPDNKELSLKRLDYIAEQYSQADYERPEDLTLDELLEQFRDSKYSTSTKDYIRRFELIFSRFLPETDVLLRQTDYIESMINKNVRIAIDVHGNSNNGVKKQLEYLGQLFNFAIKRGKTNVNPARLINDNIKPDTIKREEMPVHHYEMALELLYERNIQTAELLEVIYNSGLRVSEAISIRKEDIDLEKRVLQIRGKGFKGKVSRTFPLSGRFSKLRKLIKRILKREYHETKLFSWNNSDKPRKHFYRALADLEIQTEGTSFHAVRKLFINQLIDDNYPIRATAELAGHTLQIMEKHYVKRQSVKKQAEIAEFHKKST